MPDTPLADRDGGPYDPSLERRVVRLEEDGRQVTAAIIGLETRFDRLETKVDHLDARVDRLDTKVDRLDSKVDRLDAAVQRLEMGFIRLETMLAATLPHLATKAELANTRADVQTLRIELKSDIAVGLAEKPSKAYMWGIVAVLLAAYACGLAGLAVLK
jgi:outer membrane murein-binding lipoprotein Lpp